MILNSCKKMLLLTGCLLFANALFAFTRQDSLRGGNGAGRYWWDVRRYELSINADTATKSISGKNVMRIAFTAVVRDSMQIDLQEPMTADSIFVRSGKNDLAKRVSFVREGNVFWLTGMRKLLQGSDAELTIFFHGKPRAAVNPPWDGGFIWTKDVWGKPWISVACQGLGASSWWPCKDDQRDEPDAGARLQMHISGVPLWVGNGKPVLSETGKTPSTSAQRKEKNTPAFSNAYETKNPINTYDITFYAGDYVHIHDTIFGEQGVLNIDAFPLAGNEEKMCVKIPEIKRMIRAFEHWFGPYPFYEDGYKIVEAPFLGMEHQSAIAYGNRYMQGYRGIDRSGTGTGLLFDFIIVHESGHEWFGNSITAADIADNWIHEGFTTYSETLFAEYFFGKERAFAYMQGEWKNIRNDKPITGAYGVNDDGSSDKYDKAAGMIHTIRLLMNDDEKFRTMLRLMNQKFRLHQVTAQEIESFMSTFSGLQLQAIFEQYLHKTDLPTLVHERLDNKLRLRFEESVPGFRLPITIVCAGKKITKTVGTDWTEIVLPSADSTFSISEMFLHNSRPLR